MRRPKVEKKRAKKTSTLNLPPEVEEQVRIHSCENILRAFVVALGSLQNPISTLKSELAVAFDSQSKRSVAKIRTRQIRIRAQSYFDLPQGGRDRFLYKSAFIGWSWHLMISIAVQLTHSWSRSRRAARKNRNVSWVWCARAHASVGVLALIKAGLTRKGAAQWASRDFPKIKELAALSRQNPSSTATKILSWLTTSTKAIEAKSRIDRRWLSLLPGNRLSKTCPTKLTYCAKEPIRCSPRLSN